MGKVQTAIAEMFGREKPQQSMFAKMINSFWGSNVTADYARSDYKLFRAIYHASMIKDGSVTKGEDFILGAGFAKPIINAATAFAIGQGFNVNIENAEKGTSIQAAQDDVNRWIQEHISDFYNFTRYALREGDSFMIMHDDLSLEFAEPDTTTVIYDPISGGVQGYDVAETVETSPNVNTTFTRKFRESSYVVTESVNGGKETTLVERVFTVDGLVDLHELDDEQRDAFAGFDPEDIIEVPMPIFHFANELEPKAVYGMSDLQNSLVYFKGYSKILQEATKSNIYNSTPIPVISGDKNDGLLEADKSKKNITWGRNMVLYLKGENASAKFMDVPQTMADTGELLQYYFYLIVQASETPEFILGTAISGSKASAQEQMPIMVKKADRKRAQLSKILRVVVDCYIYKKIISGDPNFYAIQTNELDYKLSFPPIVDDDKKLTLDTISMLVEQGIMSNRTALEILASDRVNDVDKEIARAKEDAGERDSRLGLTPSDNSRIIDELDNLDVPPTDPVIPEEE